MAAILAEIDVEDLGTAKVREFRDALSDLLAVQQQVASASGGLAGGLAGSISALGSVSTASRDAAEGLAEVADAHRAIPAAAQTAIDAHQQIQSSAAGAFDSLVRLGGQLQDEASILEATALRIGQANAALTALSTTLTAGRPLLADQAALMRDLAAAANDTYGFTTQQAEALQALNEKVQAGIPLTQEEVDAFRELTLTFADTHRETLGLVSATQQLVNEQAEAEALARNAATAWAVLSDQLTAGATVTHLQKSALAELATAAQDVASIADEDKAAFAALNEEIRVGTTITPQQAAEFQRLNEVMRAAVGVTGEQVSALQQLIQAEQQAMQVSQQRAQAASILEKQLKEGAEVTELQKRALDELNQSVQKSGQFSDKTRETMESLSYALDVGARVSGRHAAQLGLVATEARKVDEASRGAGKGLESFRASTAVAATAMAALAGGLFSFLRASGDLAARVEVLGTVMEVVARNANLSTLEMSAQEQRIKALGITTSAARQAILDFVQAELDMADAAKIARAAQDLAVIANTNSSEAFSRLTTAIQIQQPRLLRQFGIMTTLDQIYRAYAVTVGKTVQQLDTLDKRQAFINKILEEGEKAAGAYEASMNDVGKQMGSMGRLTEEARVAIGENLLPVMRRVVATVSEWLKWFNELDPAIRQVTAGVLSAVAALTSMLGILAGAKFLGAAKLIDLMRGGVSTLRDAWVKAADAATSAGAATVTSAGAGSKAVTLFTTVVGFARGAVTALWAAALAHPWIAVATAIAAATGALIAFGEQGRQTADTLRESYGEVLAEINRVRDEMLKLANLRARRDQAAALPGDTPAILAVRTEAVKAYDAQVSKLNKTLEEQAKQYKINLTELTTLEGRVKAVTAAQEAQAMVIAQEVRKEYEAVRREYEASVDRLGDLRGQLGRAKLGYQEAAAAGREMFLMLVQTTDAGEIQTSVWEDLWQILKNSVIVTFYLFRDALQAVWNWLTKLPELLAAIIGWFQKLQLPPQIQQFLTIMKFLAETTLPDLRVALNAAAQATEEMANRMEPSRVEALIAAEDKRRRGLKLTLDEMKLLTEETQRQQQAAKLLVGAQQDAFEKLFPSFKPEEYAKRQKELLDAGANELANLIRMDPTSPVAQALAEKLKLVKPGEAIDVGTINAALAQIETLLEKHGKKLEEARKKAEEEARKHREAVNSFLGVDEGLAKGLAALDAALGAARSNGDLFNAVLLRGSKLLEQYHQLTDQQKAQFKGLANVIEAELIPASRAWDAALQQAVAQTEETFRAVEEASREVVMALSEEGMALNRQLREDRLTSARMVADQIEDIDRELYEQQVVGQMRAVDQAIYQEERRVEQIERSIRDEIRAREDAQRAAEEELEARVSAHQRELAMLFERARIERDIRRIELEAAVEAAAFDATALREAERRLSAFDIATAKLDERLEKLRTERQAEINREAADQREQLARAAAHGEQLTQAQLDALRRIREGSKVNIAAIRLAYDEIRKLGLTIFDSVVSSFLQGLNRMVEGTASFKDVLIGIWQSIKNALFGFFEEIVKKWIADLVRMKTASAASQAAFGGVSATSSMLGPNPMGGAAGGAAGVGGLSRVGGGLAIGGIGALVGYGVGSQFGSRTSGALAGAASGAATGAMMGSILPGIGTAIGAVIGGIAGLIGGIFGGGKEARQVTQMRDDWIKAKGGIDALKESAREAGVSIRMLLETKDLERFQREVEKVEKALELRKAKEGIAKTYTELVTLRRQVQLAGGDLQKLYNAKTIEEFNREQEKLNKLLEEQQRRLAGLGRVAEGLAVRLTGEALTIERAFKDIFPDEEDIQEFFDAFAEARKRGFTGTAADFGAKEAEEFDLDEKDLARIQGVIDQAQATIDRLALTVTATFAGILQETGDIVQAIMAVSPALDQILAIQDKLGLAASEALAPLLEFRQVIKDNEDIATSLSGLTQILLGMADANRLNQELFTSFGADAVSLFTQLQDRGVSTNNILLLMQPTLQALWEAQKEFGFQTDEATQALLDQAETAGIVGAQQQDINKKILDVLVIIAQTLGADIPEAYLAAGQAAAREGARQRGELDGVEKAAGRVDDGIRRVAHRWDDVDRAARESGGGVTSAADQMVGGLDRVIERTRKARQEFIDLRDSAVTTGEDTEEAATGAAEGHSPTGIKQISVRLREAIELSSRFKAQFLTDAVEIEKAAAWLAAIMEEIAKKPFGDWVSRERELLRPETDYRYGPHESVGTKTGETPTQTVIVTIDGRSEFRVEGTKATAREEWERLKPEAVAFMDHNTDQFGSKIAEAAARYARRRA